MYKQLVSRLSLEIEEMAPISRIFKEVQNENLREDIVVVKFQALLNLMTMCRRMIKRTRLQMEELESVSVIFQNVERHMYGMI